MPDIENPAIQVTSATSVAVSIHIPPKTEVHEFTRVVIYYSIEPSMENAQKATIELNDENNLWDTAQDVAITDMTSGLHYYFQVGSGFVDVESEPTTQDSVLVDALPDAPSQVQTATSLSPPQIRFIFNPPKPNGESTISKYRLYSSTSADFSEKFFVAEFSTRDLMQDSDDSVACMYYEPPIAIAMFYKFSAVNTMGEGPLSEASPETLIDFAPNRPLKPVVKRISSSAIQITSSVEPNQGSAPQSYLITMYRVNHKKDLVDRKDTLVVAQFAHPNEVTHVLDGLLPEKTYKFYIHATNPGGDSDISDGSDNVEIDGLVPAAVQPKVQILTSQSVKLTLEPSQVEKPVIVSAKIGWALDREMHNIVGTVPIAKDATEYVVEGLPEGTICNMILFKKYLSFINRKYYNDDV